MLKLSDSAWRATWFNFPNGTNFSFQNYVTKFISFNEDENFSQRLGSKKASSNHSWLKDDSGELPGHFYNWLEFEDSCHFQVNYQFLRFDFSELELSQQLINRVHVVV